jgi:hypothetical protein
MALHIVYNSKTEPGRVKHEREARATRGPRVSYIDEWFVLIVIVCRTHILISGYLCKS